MSKIEFTAIADDAKPQAFLRGWTRKEAILKGLGIGLAGLSAHYETQFATGGLTPNFARLSHRPGSTSGSSGRPPPVPISSPPWPSTSHEWPT